jgi:glucokinase
MSKVPHLVADIGGTNARLALATCERELKRQQIYECGRFDSLSAVFKSYLADLSDKPSAAAIAIANPVLGDWVKMTNAPWQFSKENLRRELQLERLVVLNDFTALALAIPHLQPHEAIQCGGGGARVNAAVGVIGPGTGLGVSGLVWNNGDWHPLASEGGHATYTPVSEREQQVAAVLSRKFGHVSAERIISGQGLENVYQALSELNGNANAPLSAAEITARALAQECEQCVETLTIFCASLGTVAGNLALTLGALGGVYLGGGIVPKILPFLQHSQFRERFENKGRFTHYLAEIPTYVITAPYPALAGAMIALEK